MAKKARSKGKPQGKKSSSSKPKRNFGQIGQYLISKSGAKYIKLQAKPNADKEVKALVKKIVQVLGTDVLFINLFDAEFREKYNIADFVKGNISVDMDADEAPESDDDDSEDEDEDEDDSEDDDDESEDEDEDDEDDDSDF